MKIPQKTTSGLVGIIMGFAGGTQYQDTNIEDEVRERIKATEQEFYPGVVPNAELRKEDED